jgi:hypothetical protein
MMGVDDFANGDMTTTMIQTEKGKTLLIEHDVYTYVPTTACINLQVRKALPTNTQALASPCLTISFPKVFWLKTST